MVDPDSSDPVADFMSVDNFRECETAMCSALQNTGVKYDVGALRKILFRVMEEVVATSEKGATVRQLNVLAIEEAVGSFTFPYGEEESMSGQAGQAGQVGQEGQEPDPYRSIGGIQHMILDLDSPPRHRESLAGVSHSISSISGNVARDNASTRVVSRYIALSGADRDLLLERTRYAYTASVSGYHGSSLEPLRNIVSMNVSAVIIPMEATRLAMSDTLVGGAILPREITFSHPYLLLNVENMPVYDGSNDAIRRSFAFLRYDRSYRTPTGRGYIVLVPAQKEALLFEGAPLASLPNLRIALTKPNGQLVSNALDDYSIDKIEYEAFNRTYIKLITNKYFQRDDFFKGDAVSISSCTGVPANLATFLCRAEGHDIVEIGQPNDDGFFRSFYIPAPGGLDATLGHVVTDPDLIQMVRDHGDVIKANVLNASLQMIMAFTVSIQRHNPVKVYTRPIEELPPKDRTQGG